MAWKSQRQSQSSVQLRHSKSSANIEMCDQHKKKKVE